MSKIISTLSKMWLKVTNLENSLFPQLKESLRIEEFSSKESKLIKILERVKRIADYRLDVPEDLEPVIESSINFSLDDPELTEEQKEAIRRQYHYPTVSLNIFHGGKKINVVPDYAEASIDVRLTPGVNSEAVKEQFENLASESGVKDYKIDLSIRDGYYEKPQSKAVIGLSKAVEEALGVKPILKLMWGGTDGYYTHVFSGIPSPAFGFTLTLT